MAIFGNPAQELPRYNPSERALWYLPRYPCFRIRFTIASYIIGLPEMSVTPRANVCFNTA